VATSTSDLLHYHGADEIHLVMSDSEPGAKRSKLSAPDTCARLCSQRLSAQRIACYLHVLTIRPRSGAPTRTLSSVTRLGLFFLLCLGLAVVQAADSSAPKHKPDVWYVATSAEIVDRMVDIGRVHPGDVVYDLGCGDGRLVIAAAKKFGTRGVGVDIDPDLIRVARANAKAEGVADLVTFRVQDLFETDLREATVVLMYLLPEVNRRLKPKLFAELRPGARVVSHNWDMGPSWLPDRAVHLGHEEVFLWVMPENSAALAQH